MQFRLHLQGLDNEVNADHNGNEVNDGYHGSDNDSNAKICEWVLQ